MQKFSKLEQKIKVSTSYTSYWKIAEAFRAWYIDVVWPEEKPERQPLKYLH